MPQTMETLRAVAAEARKRQQARHIRVAALFGIPEVTALEWIQEADEKGLDTGRPREGQERRRKK